MFKHLLLHLYTVKNKGAKYHDFSISRIGRTWIGRKISHFGASTILKYETNKRSDVNWTRNKSFHRWKFSKKKQYGVGHDMDYNYPILRPISRRK